MLSRRRFWGAVLLSGVVAGGCHSRPAAGVKKVAVDESSARAGASDRPSEKIAQAHAHYAAAVVHEMNDETEAALDDFYKAAFDDPEDQVLVLEVSRRFIQNKQ